MVKGSFILKGNHLVSGINNVLTNLLTEGKSSSYPFENGTVYFFDEHDWFTTTNYCIVAVIDNRLFDAKTNFLEIHSYTLGGKTGIFEWDLWKREKKCLSGFHKLISGYCKGYEWQIEPLEIKKS